jgi:hypothetical protein
MKQSSAVFISYRREDSRAYAGRLYDKLSAHFGPKNVFMDVTNIDTGVNFVKSLNNNLAACGAVVVVIGKQWSTLTDVAGRRRLDDVNDFVRQEIATALRSGVLVIPALVDGAQMPKVDQLPEDIQTLAHRNAVEISDSMFRFSIARLIEVLQQKVSPYSSVPRLRKYLLLYRPRGSNVWAAAAWLFRAGLLVSFVAFCATAFFVLEPVKVHPIWYVASTTRSWSDIVFQSLFLVLVESPSILLFLGFRKGGSWCDAKAVQVERTRMKDDF